MILTILSLLDILAALSLMFGIHLTPILVFFGLFLFLKSLYSLLSSFSRNSYADWLGATDLLAAVGIFMFLTIGTNSFVDTVSKLLLFKGLYCLIRGWGM